MEKDIRQRYPSLEGAEVAINGAPLAVLYHLDFMWSACVSLMSSVSRPKYHISPISLAACATKSLARLGNVLNKWPRAPWIEEEEEDVSMVGI